MDEVNKHIMETGRGSADGQFWNADRIVCNDGFSMSVQASKYHYCSPRQTNAFPYTAVEIGFPTRRELLLAEWAEDKKRLTKTVYGWVPVDVVVEVIKRHGGLRKASAKKAA